MYETMLEVESMRRSAFIRSLLPISVNGKLLDVGCYRAYLRKFLPKEVEYFGLDLISYSSSEFNLVLTNLNLSSIPFRSEVFDIVIAADVLEHLFFPEKILKEISRVLKSDGLAIISFPNEVGLCGRYSAIKRHFFTPPKSLEEQVHGHHWFFTIEIARKFVSRYFEIVDERPYVGHIGSKMIPGFILKVVPSLCSGWFMKLKKRAVTL